MPGTRWCSPGIPASMTISSGSRRGRILLVHEVVAPELQRRLFASNVEWAERIIAHHTTPEQAGAVFARMRPKLAVYSHIVPVVATADDLIPPTRQTYAGPVEVGEDLMRIDIGDTVTVQAGQLRRGA
jgi:ribonuclease Z